MEVKKKKKRFGDGYLLATKNLAAGLLTRSRRGLPLAASFGRSGGKAFAGRTEEGNIWLTRIA